MKLYYLKLNGMSSFTLIIQYSFILLYNIIDFFFSIFRESKDDNLEQELSLADRRNKREIRLLEGEIPLWQVIVEKLNAASKIFYIVSAAELALCIQASIVIVNYVSFDALVQ